MKQKILIIEDDLNAARRIVLLCREMGHDPLLARDGFTGMLLAKRLKPRLIISDTAIPGMDGFELARRVRNHDELRETAVVAVTQTVPAHPAANQPNFDAVMTKPLEDERVECIINQFCAEVAEVA
jgi:CheY-like chemotaxis protein